MDSNHGRVIDPNPEFESPKAEPAESTVFSWPPAENASVLEALATTWRDACFRPTRFFRQMPRSGAYGWVLVYYLVIGVMVAGIDLFWQSVLGWSLADRLLREQSSGMDDLVGFLLSPLILICALYLVTGVCHLLLLVMRGAGHGFETSSRVFAFSYSPGLLNVVPVVGSFAAVVWMTVLAIIGLREAHQTDGAKAAAAVLIPLFLLIGLLVMAVVAAMLMGVLGERL